jgi:predicted heme/steroid binding protein
MGRVGGLISIAVNGTRLDAVGSFDWNDGTAIKTGMVGHDRVHGFQELPAIPFIEGEIRVTPGLDLRAIKNTRDATVTLELPSGHVIVLRNAWFAGEGTASTEEGNMGARFEGLSCDISNPAAA